MQAKVTVEFMGKPDTEVLARRILVGEEISGELARVAVELKFAEEVAVEPDIVETAMAKELNEKTVEQLKALAVEKTVDLGSASKKAEIVAALLAALDKPEEPPVA